MSKQVEHGRVVAFHWESGEYAAREVTAEVEHEDGTHTLLVLPVDRMSFRLPAKKRKGRLRRVEKEAPSS